MSSHRVLGDGVSIRCLHTGFAPDANENDEISSSMLILIIAAGSSHGMPSELWHHMHGELCAAPMYMRWWYPIWGCNRLVWPSPEDGGATAVDLSIEYNGMEEQLQLI